MLLTPMTDEEVSVLDDLLDLEEGLTRWEVNFIEGLDKHRRYALGRGDNPRISEGQRKALAKIQKDRL